MAAFPQGRRAFLVIHGIGEQNPFETLDSFAAGIAAELTAGEVPFEMQHRIAERRRDNTEWTESYVRLAPQAGTDDGKDYIDVHELWWADLTEEKISVSGVLNWLLQTARGTARYYREDKALQDRYEQRRHECRGRFKFPLYGVVLALIFIYPLLATARRLLPQPLLRGLRGWLEKRATAIIVGYVGDVAIYTTTDEKSRYYRIRQQILARAQTLLEALMGDPQYERVVVAGHSLGSVIAYDTLNRVNIKANLSDGQTLQLHKLAGLITFGSPLDKIAFFFREHVPSGQYIRRQIVAFLHSFKARPLDGHGTPTIALTSVVQRKLEELPWVNYYACNDPVSGHLDFYNIDDSDNVNLKLPQPWGAAHLGYWHSAEFYRDIAARFLA